MNKIIIRYIFLILEIILVNGKNIKENELLNGKKSIHFEKNFEFEKSQNRFFNWFYDIEDYEKNKTSEENNNLIIGRNNLIDSISKYSLNLNNYEYQTIQILLYTNLTNNLILVNGEDNNINISTSFFIITNDIIRSNKNILDFEVVSKNGIKQGFLDIYLLNNTEKEFELRNLDNQKNDSNNSDNNPRKSFYNKRNITLKTQETKMKYFINIIPDEKDSDQYYLHYDYSDSSQKENIKIYYLNDFGSYTLEEIIKKKIKIKEKTRDWQLKGNNEIFWVEYKNLKKEINITLVYTKIKGKGILGFIITMSVLFALFLITLGIFLKNAYFGNIRTNSDEEK